MAPRLPGKWKGRVKRNESEAEKMESIKKAQSMEQQKALNKLAAKKAAEELQKKRRLEMEGRKGKDKIDPMKAARALAGNKDGVIIKLFWGAWKIGVKICQQEKALQKREKWWRKGCTRDGSCVGGCGACNLLKDSTYQLPFGAEAKSMFGVKEAGTTLLAASRLSFGAVGLPATGLGIDIPERATTAPSGMNRSGSLPSLGAMLPGVNRPGTSSNVASRLQSGRWEETPQIGHWEEAVRWGSGQKCWYNKRIGRISYVDPVRHSTENVAQLGMSVGHSRHYTEASHLAAEQKAEYLQAQESSHFRHMGSLSQGYGSVNSLDLGETRIGRF